MGYSGWLYDGQTAVRHTVQVEAEPDGLKVTGDDGLAFIVSRELLLHLNDVNGEKIYGRRDAQGWRLGISDEAASHIGSVLPAAARYGSLVDRIGLLRTVAVGITLSAGLLFVGYNAPEWLAPQVPLSLEQKVADAMGGDLGGRYCGGPQGQAALDKLTQRLSSAGMRLTVRVVDIIMVNAAALPGGNIILFRGLIAEAESPDEVAGVLAHEISHVEERHVTEAMIRDLTVSTIVAAFGGNIGSGADLMMSLSYDRSAEREADEGAIAALERANVSPAPTADFFAMLAKVEKELGSLGENLEYLSTHPLSQEREKLFRAAATKRTYQPALSPTEWSALQNICSEV